MRRKVYSLDQAGLRRAAGEANVENEGDPVASVMPKGRRKAKRQGAVK